MKNLLHTLLLSSFFFCISCSEDVLDQNPRTSLSSEVFWKSESDVQSALVGLYAPLLYGFGGYASSAFAPSEFDAYTPDSYAQYNYGAAQSSYIQGINPSSGGFVSDTYGYCYGAITPINIFFTNVDRVENLEATKLAAYKGEAYFLRAFFYYQLARLYGNVPLITKPFLGESIPKNTRKEVLAQIIKDLDKAIASLPDKVYDGHAVKGSAQALKMHVLLFNHNYKDTATIGKAMIDAGIHGLAATYNDNFLAKGQQGNKEILFSVVQNPPLNQFSPPTDRFLGAWLSNQPTINIVNDYETINGLKTADDPAWDSTKPYEKRDPRLLLCIIPEEYPHLNLNSGFSTDNLKLNESGLLTGFALKKFLNVPYKTTPTNGYQSGQDWVLLRFADVLLMYAEAENEINGPTGAYSPVNQVRQRVKMPVLPAGLSKDNMKERIRHERRIELAFENWRYFDLRRWGIAKKEINGTKRLHPTLQENETPGKYEAHHEYWPLPQGNLLRNKELKQNPGY